MYSLQNRITWKAIFGNYICRYKIIQSTVLTRGNSFNGVRTELNHNSSSRIVQNCFYCFPHKGE